MAINREIIVQIIPAEGWYAVYAQDDPPYYFTVQLVGWALVEPESEPHERDVRGLNGRAYIEFSTDATNFLTYVHETGMTEEAREAWANEGRRQAFARQTGSRGD